MGDVFTRCRAQAGPCQKSSHRAACGSQRCLIELTLEPACLKNQIAIKYQTARTASPTTTIGPVESSQQGSSTPSMSKIIAHLSLPMLLKMVVSKAVGLPAVS